MEEQITKEDLDLIDKIFSTVEIKDDDNVDIEKLKEAIRTSEECPEDKKEAIIGMLDSLKGELHWTDFLDTFKVGMLNNKKPEKGKTILKKRISRSQRSKSVKKKEVRWANQLIDDKEEVLVEAAPADTVNVPLTKSQRQGLLRMFNRMDPNGDGFVTEEEFTSYMTEHRTALGSTKIREL